jgi:RNA polymerase sigma-70 factor, ECF subfamily
MLDPALVERLYARGDAARWHVPREDFAAALAVSLERTFKDRSPSARERERYLAALHLGDLALACACALGHEPAWEHFVREHRPILYRAADALDPSGGAREIADGLYAELYGLPDPGGPRRSLFRYFHGRSSLSTWLRAVLAQRHVDAVRARRRTEPLPEGDGPETAGLTPPLDPDRPRLWRAMHAALAGAVARLVPQDRLRLRSYYVAGLTLAQIGRLTGEHEATVSRQLKRARRTVRELTERLLRDEAHLGDDEIARCVELAVEVDPDRAFDVQELLGAPGDRKREPPDRST